MPKWPWPNTRLGTLAHVELAAYFDRPLPKPGTLLKGLASLSCDLFGDYAATLSVGSVDREVTLSRVRDEPVDASIEWFRLSCAAGRGPLSRSVVDASYHRIYAHHYLQLELSLADVPDARLRRVQPAIDRFFELAVKSGDCMGGFADIHETRPHWPTGILTFPGFSDPTVIAERAVRWDEIPKIAPHRGSLHWITLFAPRDLASLGGRAKFAAEAGRHAVNVGSKRPLVRSCGEGHLLVELGPIVEIIAKKEPETSDGDLVVDHFAAAWLMRRLADAEFFAWQHWSPPDSRSNRIVAASTPTPFPKHSDRAVSAARAAAADARFQRLQSSPPDCFRHDPKPTDARVRKWVAKEYGDFSTSFLAADASGNTELPVWGRFQDNSIELTDPIIIGDPRPRECSFIFQSHRHGYDGKQGHNHWPRTKAPDLFHCPKCGHDRFRAMTVFQYDDQEEPDLTPRERAAPEDFFDWLAILLTCPKCDWFGRVAEFECA